MFKLSHTSLPNSEKLNRELSHFITSGDFYKVGEKLSEIEQVGNIDTLKLLRSVPIHGGKVEAERFFKAIHELGKRHPDETAETLKALLQQDRQEEQALYTTTRNPLIMLGRLSSEKLCEFLNEKFDGLFMKDWRYESATLLHFIEGLEHFASTSPIKGEELSSLSKSLQALHGNIPEAERSQYPFTTMPKLVDWINNRPSESLLSTKRERIEEALSRLSFPGYEDVINEASLGDFVEILHASNKAPAVSHAALELAKNSDSRAGGALLTKVAEQLNAKEVNTVTAQLVCKAGEEWVRKYTKAVQSPGEDSSSSLRSSQTRALASCIAEHLTAIVVSPEQKGPLGLDFSQETTNHLLSLLLLLGEDRQLEAFYTVLPSDMQGKQKLTKAGLELLKKECVAYKNNEESSSKKLLSRLSPFYAYAAFNEADVVSERNLQYCLQDPNPQRGYTSAAYWVSEDLANLFE